MLSTLRSITVVNWPEELFRDHYNPAPGVAGTVVIRIDKLLTSVWNCVAIEITKETDSRGKYLFIFNRTPANAAYMRHEKGVLFLKGHISLKN
jgi:hypothetical protein